MYATEITVVPAPLVALSFETLLSKYAFNEDGRYILRSMDGIRSRMKSGIAIHFEGVNMESCLDSQLNESIMYAQRIFELTRILRLETHVRTRPMTFRWGSYTSGSRAVESKVILAEVVMAHMRVAMLHCASGFKYTKDNTTKAEQSFREAVTYCHMAAAFAGQWKGQRNQELSVSMLRAMAQLCSTYVDRTRLRTFEYAKDPKTGAKNIVPAGLYMSMAESYMLSNQQLDAATYEDKGCLPQIMADYARMMLKAMNRCVSPKFDPTEMEMYDPALGLRMGEYFARFLRGLDPSDPGGCAQTVEDGATVRRAKFSMSRLREVSDEEVQQAIPLANKRLTQPAYETGYAQACAAMERYDVLPNKIIFTN